jgi:hypothetical protein
MATRKMFLQVWNFFGKISQINTSEGQGIGDDQLNAEQWPVGLFYLR